MDLNLFEILQKKIMFQNDITLYNNYLYYEVH